MRILGALSVLVLLLPTAGASLVPSAAVDDPMDIVGAAGPDASHAGQHAPIVGPEAPSTPMSTGLPAVHAPTPPLQAGADEKSLQGQAMASSSRTAQEVIDFVLSTPFGQLDSPGQEGVRMLQPQPPNGTQPQNGTNGTVLAGNHTGRHTHTHPTGGDNGLGAVWAAPFYGSPRHVLLLDVDGDGTNDPVTATDIGIVAVSAGSGDVIWAHLIGNAVTSLFLIDADGDGQSEIGFSTLWQAQLPRVGVLRADGTKLWEVLGEQPFLAAGPTGEGGVLAIDLKGYHHRFDARSGAVDWSSDVELLHDDPPLNVVYQILGHYLASFGDLNGDGVGDSVSAGMYHYGAPFAVDNVFTIIHAVDGATGQKLWIHPIGLEPPVLGVATHVLSDLDVLDARGDGSLDVSYSGQSYRWPLLWLVLVPFAGIAAIALMHYETYVRAVDGSSQDLAEPLGGRTIVTPVLPVEAYLDIDHTDIDADGLDEVAVIRAGVADALLFQATSQLEFYRLLPSQAKAPTDFVLSPVTYHFNQTARLHGGAVEQGRALVASVQGQGAGSLLAVAPDMSLLAEVVVDRTPRAAAIDGPTLVSAQDGRLDVLALEDAGKVQSRSVLRSSPIDFAADDLDGDGYADVYVLADDGSIHVVDGVTGNFLRTIDLGVQAEALWLRQATDDRVPDLLVQRPGGPTSARSVDLWDGQRLSVKWTTPLTLAEPLWFHGNDDGVPDFLASIDRFAGTATAIDGLTGATLWTAPVPYTYFNQGGFMVDHTPGIQEDLLLWDVFEGFFVLDGASGKTLWSLPANSSVNGVCGGSFDADGDGVGEALLLFRSGGTFQQVAVSPDGKQRNVAILPSDVWSASCTTHQAGRSLLLEIVYFTTGNDAKQGLVRFDGSTVWSTLSGSFISEFGAQKLLGIDPGGKRVVYAREDHVYSLDWDDGSTVGEFVVNGPFVEGGVLLDVDRMAPLEAIAYTGDGIAWLLSEDSAGLAAMLQLEAEAQGKKPVEDAEALPESAKKTPGIALLLPLVAALFARRRRA